MFFLGLLGKHALHITVALLFLSSAYGQDTSLNVRGIVRNCEDSEPIILANVVAYGESSIRSYTTTDETGRYEIVLEGDEDYILFSALGFVKDTVHNIPNTDTLLDLCLIFDNTIAEITVVDERLPMQIKGDTVRFSVDKFLTGRESNLQDVLTKLPGVQIDDDGEIKYGGRTIDIVEIDGDRFMDSNRESLLNGLRADDINIIDIVDDSKTNRVSLNIRLEDDAKNKLSASIEVLGGVSRKYDSSIYGYKLGSQLDIFATGRLNNTGRQVATVGDYLRQTGGPLGQGNNLGRLSVPSYFRYSDLFADLDNQYISIDWSLESKKKLQLAGYYNLYRSNSVDERVTSLISPQISFSQVEDGLENSLDKGLGLGVRGVYLYNKSYLKFGITTNYTNTELNDSSEIYLLDSSPAQTYNQAHDNSQLEYIAYVNGQNILARYNTLNWGVLYKSGQLNQDARFYSSASFPFAPLVGNIGDNIYQEEGNGVGYLSAHVNSTTIVSDKIEANLSMNSSLINTSNDLLVDTTLNSGLWSGAIFDFVAQAQYVKDYIRIRAGASLEYSDALIINIDNVENKMVIRPEIEINLMSKNQKNRLRFSINSNTINTNYDLISDELAAFKVLDYTSIERIIQSKQEFYNNTSVDLLYSSIQPTNGRAFFALGKHTFGGQPSSIIDNSVDNVITTTDTISIPNNNTFLGLFYSLKPITSKIGANFDGIISRFTNSTFGQGSSAYTNILSVVNLNVSYDFDSTLTVSLSPNFAYNAISYRSVPEQSSFIRYGAGIELDGSVNSIIYNLTYDVLMDRSTIGATSLHNVGVLLRWRYSTALEFMFSGSNIANLKSAERFSSKFTDGFLREQRTQMLPGYLLIGVTVRL